MLEVDFKHKGLELTFDEKKKIYLDSFESKIIVEELEKIKEKNPAFFRNIKKITINDLLKNTSVSSIDGLFRINFGFVAYYRIFPSHHISFTVDFEDGSYLEHDLDLDDVISAEEIYFNKINNHILRSLLSDDLKDYIENKSGFEIYINEEKVNIYEFFDEDKTITYESYFSSDT